MTPRRFLAACPFLLIAVLLDAASPGRAASGDPASGDPPLEVSAHPLIHAWHKEGYNLWAEVKTALEQQAYADAAQLIFEAPPEVERGLLVDFRDPWLLLPYPAVIGSLVDDYPPLREALWERYGALAGLRVGAAVAGGNSEALQALAVQFRGSAPAVEALGGLGDRSLAAGHFLAAMRHYQGALEQAGPSQRPALAARIRLTGAMLGNLVGEPVQSPVELGKSRLSPAEFERLIAELVESRSAAGSGGGWGGLRRVEVPAAPNPGRFAARPLGTPDSDSPSKPGRRWPSPSFDWSADTLAVVAAAGTLVASDGRRAAAVGLDSGQTKWFREFSSHRSYPPPWKWGLFQPLIAADRVYMRSWTQHGLEMHCLDLDSGKPVWSAGGSESYACSDALVDEGRLVFLTAAIEEPPGSRKGARPPVHRPYRGQLKHRLVWQLQWTALEPASGKLRARWPLVRLQSKERMAPLCQATAAGDAIVAAFAGGVLCVDLAGRLRWVRRQPWGDTAAQPPHLQPPLVVEGQVFLAPAGADALECLDLATGRLRWRCVAPNVVRLVGLAAGRLIAQDGAGLLGIEAAGGRIAWRHEAAGLLDGFLCGGPGQLACTVYRFDASARWSPALVWLDPLTGQPVAERLLDGLGSNRQVPRSLSLGPMIAAGGRLFAAHHDPGRGRNGLYLLEPAALDDTSTGEGMADPFSFERGSGN